MTLWRWKDKLHTGKKNLQTTYLTKYSYLEYRKNIQNARAKKKSSYVMDKRQIYIHWRVYQIRSDQSLSHVRLFATPEEEYI